MNIILKSILAGLLLGAALFILPFFLLRVFLFFLLIGGLFRLIRGRRGFGPRGFGYGRRGFAYGGPFGFADRVRQMSDEEYTAFKERGWNRCGDAPAQSNQSTETTNA
ncbi:hypothetical protein [Spirosoma montaniterrae]|uniref:Uncharacterized protein n=1 Tax=Spirosoma montaniterrae TaxID=1178516 RepID=A0A1P9X2V3_9BACT|nr:hypothetical protein [Spirosoma montaniterrae]AQG81925.1 hypothetical protein AWR27_23085 [Spirosoma montaniterrae]